MHRASLRLERPRNENLEHPTQQVFHQWTAYRSYQRHVVLRLEVAPLVDVTENKLGGCGLTALYNIPFPALQGSPLTIKRPGNTLRKMHTRPSLVVEGWWQ